jgi:hypothetical protein
MVAINKLYKSNKSEPTNGILLWSFLEILKISKQYVYTLFRYDVDHRYL